jgi:hypothetical protein
MGNIRQDMTTLGRGFGNILNWANVVFATPFAIADSVPVSALSIYYTNYIITTDTRRQ